MHLSEAVAKRIAYLCSKKALSVNRLSAMCGLRQSTLSNIINGNSKTRLLLQLKNL